MSRILINSDDAADAAAVIWNVAVPALHRDRMPGSAAEAGMIAGRLTAAATTRGFTFPTFPSLPMPPVLGDTTVSRDALAQAANILADWVAPMLRDAGRDYDAGTTAALAEILRRSLETKQGNS